MLAVFHWPRMPMKRREFIAAPGSAAAMTLAARAQQSARVRLVGALMNAAIDDPEMRANLAGIRKRLRQLGWAEGRNVRLDFRGFAGNPSRLSQYPSELVSSPDVILAAGVPQVKAIQATSRVIPIVFA